jgi:hypothetical protein
MDTLQEREVNQAAYRRLKDEIGRNYPRGHFVAIAGGQIVADAEDFEKLCSLLRTMGKDPSHALVVQAGVDYPEAAVIFSVGKGS